MPQPSVCAAILLQELRLFKSPEMVGTEALISLVFSQHSSEAARLALRTLEQTGMRVGELRDLEWRDVDLAESRFRIRQGKTATARRWVALPGWLMGEITETCPPDDRIPERRVFTGFLPDVAKNVVARACKAAGIPHFHPHDFRHRYASVKLREGIPVTDLGRATRTLEEVHDARHLLARSPRRIGGTEAGAAVITRGGSPGTVNGR